MSEGSALDFSVLVLNRYYMSVRVVDVRRAMTLLYRGCAEVITIEDEQYCSYDFESWCELSLLHAMEKQEGEDFLRTPHQEVQVPRIVRLVLYDRVPKSSVRFNRKNYLRATGIVANTVGKTRPMSQLSLDHVLPRSQGGKTTWENVVCSCMNCNSRRVVELPCKLGCVCCRNQRGHDRVLDWWRRSRILATNPGSRSFPLPSVNLLPCGQRALRLNEQSN